ncbi:MAG: uracil-DNA glycosylase, partial [Polyangiales bacterium]
MSDELRAELACLARAARAHLEVEEDLGNAGLPAWQGARSVGATRALAEASAQPASASPVAEETVTLAVTLPPADAAEKHMRLQQLASEATTCQACVLHEKRKQSVFARGSESAELAFVGEGPGQEEDRQGLPFVGPAGQLLDRMIAAMGYGRDEVYVCNIVKCRPPDNRTPRPEEAIACARFLVPQLELVAPKLIVALGRCAAENLGVARAGASWRGRFGAWRGIPVLPTYHPAYLLRTPEHKRVVWEDLQLALTRLGRTPPQRGRP